ncbi:hypothetical protein [Herbidospora cretacea]|uniref:hypothetical protein n=1 Tax=Herbidospora cretacea TaxID=28444 RepID=UPI000A82F480|nr:hypothetical protein [Herbidospora cretacea]
MDREGLFRLDTTEDVKTWITNAAKSRNGTADLRHEGINIALDELEHRGELRRKTS